MYIGSKKTGEPPATHDWKKYSGTVDVPRSAKRLAVALQIYGPGAIRFDDVEVEYAR